MSTDPQVSSEKQATKHRHSWMVAWSYKTPGGRTKEELRCRFCSARKGAYVKEQLCQSK